MGSRSHSINDKYSIKEITGLNEFMELRTVWDNLAEKQRSYVPFLCFDWYKIWLEHFLKENQLLILLVYREGILLAIIPFMIKREKFKGLSVRKIELVGNFYSPIRNFILKDIDDTEKEKVLLLIFNYLNGAVNWDIIDLNSLPEECFNFKLFCQVIKEDGFKGKEYFCFGNWYLDGINFDGNQYIQSRNSNIRNNLKRYRRSLERIGKLEFIMVTNGSDERIDHFMDHYYIVYHNSWKEKETDAALHRDIAKFARDKGWLRLGLLLLENTPIAVQLWLVCKGTAYILKLAYDENYKKFIPGIILSSEMMKYVIDIDRVGEVDYGIGDEPYKKDWTPKRRERKGFLVYNNSIKGNYLALLNNRILPIFNKNKYLKKIKGMIADRLR
jgi:CelD/BcsL family acetyltransferase involved in cellulose biosynthesis